MDEQEAWAHQLMLERYREACEALDRCAKAGVDTEALRVLAREAGIDIKHIDLGATRLG